MRAIKAALLWTLGVAAVLLAPTAATPAPPPLPAATARPATSVTSGQHATRPSPASTQRSGVPDAPVVAAAKAANASGFNGSGVPGDRVQQVAITPAAAPGPTGRVEAGPRFGADPGAHLGRSPPTTPGA